MTTIHWTNEIGVRRRQAIAVLALIAGSALTPCAQAHGDLHERIAALTEQIRTHQGDAELWLQRANLERQHGDLDAALADLDHAAQLKPGWAAAHLQRARIGFESGNYAGCERAATDCLELEPSKADALVLRARALAHLGKAERAASDYDAVLNATGSATPLPDLYLERARALAVLERWDDAIRGLDSGMNRLGATPSLALPAIEYERRSGAFEAALARLEHAKGFLNEASYGKLRAEIIHQRDNLGRQ